MNLQIHLGQIPKASGITKKLFADTKETNIVSIKPAGLMLLNAEIQLYILKVQQEH